MNPQSHHLNADRFAKALKRRTMEQLDWDRSVEPATLNVRMPDRTVGLIVRHDASGKYAIEIAPHDSATMDLHNRVQDCLNDYRLQHAPEGRYDLAQLRELFGKVQQEYRRIHQPQSLRLPPVRDTALESIVEGERVYSYSDVVAALKGTVRLKWEPRHHYGRECIELAMPDPSTSLLISRTHTKEGPRYAVFVAHAEEAPPARLNDTQAHIHKFMQRRDAKITQQNGLDNADLRDLIHGVRRFPANLEAEPLPQRQRA